MELLNDLLKEQEKEKQRQEYLLNEQKQALYFLEVKAAADILKNAGITTSVRNIAEFANLFDAEVQAAIDWFQRKGPGKMPFEVDAESEPRSMLDQVIAGLSWIANRRLNRTKGRKTPPLDRSVLGVQKIMQLTGLGRVDILNTVNQNLEAIEQKYPDFKISWVDDDQSVIQKNNKNQHQDTKIAWIRKAVEDIAAGRVGSVTAEQLERWQNNKIGLTKRQIDKLLSEHPDLRDLDKYRARGRNTNSMTDADREARYMREHYQRG